MSQLLLLLIRFYRSTSNIRRLFFLPFFTLPSCRFTPTCSQYTYQAIAKYGSFKGVYLGLKRLIKCNPWNNSTRYY